MSRVDLLGLAAATSKQQQAASKQQHARNGEKSNSVVVLEIRVKFWCMIPMGVKYNHTKFERETRRWQLGKEFASGGPQFQKLQLRAKKSHFWAKKAREHIQNGQTKGNGRYTSRAA